jgi:uncharacterized protein with gpF-like domain
MAASAAYFVRGAWRRAGLSQDALAHDLAPEVEMTKAFKKLAKQWQKAFDASAEKVAKSFANKNRQHHDQAFRTALNDAGFTVKFQTTPAIEAALDGAIADNVDLIKSIPKQYFEGLRERIKDSVEKGRGMKGLTESLQHEHGLTRARAALIVRDQNNKVTALVHRLRQKEVGITKAVWIHTTASKEPREEHEDWGAEGKMYDVAKGMYSEEAGDYVWPGTEINCGCTDMSVVPSDEDEEAA